MERSDDAPVDVDRLRSVLLVDDEEDLRETLRWLLESALPGTRVLTAASAHEALEIAAEARIDVLVTDFRMPGMNGMDLLVHAQQLYPGVARVLLTAYPDLAGSAQVVRQARVDLLLTKPFDPALLVGSVRSLLAGTSLPGPPVHDGEGAPVTP